MPADTVFDPAVLFPGQGPYDIDGVFGMPAAALQIVLIFFVPAQDAQIMAQGGNDQFLFVDVDMHLFQQPADAQADDGNAQAVVGDGHDLVVFLTVSFLEFFGFQYFLAIFFQ